MPEASRDLTGLLRDWTAGDERALERLTPIVYADLRRLAAAYMRNERHEHTLQPTALAHEAFMKLVELKRIDWRDRGHFLALAAQSMRRILVDHGRQRRAAKRQALVLAVRLDDTVAPTDELAAPAIDLDVLTLHEALAELAELDPRQSRIVELRFFGGLTIDETARVLGVSPATVKIDWTLARAWLFRRLDGDGQ